MVSQVTFLFSKSKLTSMSQIKPMKSTKFNFKNSKGEDLSGRIELPLEDEPKAFVIFAHCFTCNKNLTAVRNIAREISGHGFGILLFDFTGLGESEGEFSETDFSSNVDDLITASNLIAEMYDLPQVLIGHSLGGAAVVKAAAKLDRVSSLVTIGAPFDPHHVSHMFSEEIDEIKNKGQAEVNIGGRPFKISKQFIEDLEDQDPEKTIEGLRRPILVMHSPQDTIVGIKNAAKIYIAARHPKSFISLDGADHLLSRKQDSLYTGRMIANWIEANLERGLKKNSKANSESTNDVDEGFVRAVTSQDSFTTPLLTSKHRLLADEPQSVGGSELGPTPYDLLASSLAACTSMTIQMYAKRKGWPLENVTVEVKHGRKHKIDCDDSEDKPKMIDHFDKRIQLEGDLDKVQRQKLYEIGSRCPVHKTLSNTIEIDSTLFN